MFDLVTGKTMHIPHTPALPIVVSMAAQVAIVGVIILVPVLYMTDTLPAPQTMMAFVATPPPPPPPPLPPPAPPAPAPAKAPDRPVPTTGATAPVEAPSRIEPEPIFDSGEEGIPGGVEGGVPGGVLGGIVGGLELVPPPPPPPPPAPRAPIRTGGDIKAPALLHRVEPVYPAVATAANIEGTVILDAIVDEEGRVTDVKVLRSAGLLDRAAIDAVRQWRYAPLMLNGTPASFQLTVVLSFRLTR